ncbi:MAG: hypothetical protein ABF662_00070 [Liquorilactobacillus satsumensis]
MLKTIDPLKYADNEKCLPASMRPQRFLKLMVTSLLVKETKSAKQF